MCKIFKINIIACFIIGARCVFDCGNGRHVSANFLCDGDDDCGNSKDELNCEENKATGANVHTERTKRGAGCAENFFDCGNGRCVSNLWICDGDNDCLNHRDEHNCGIKPVREGCLSSQFECKSDGHCIPVLWRCDGENDCDDGSDENKCNDLPKCAGFLCNNTHCIPRNWHCDGNKDCSDGSDEELCSEGKICAESDFLCSSGSCINKSLVCNKHKDCSDGSDEGLHCDDSCKNSNCSQICEKLPTGHKCFCHEGYALQDDQKTCTDINECLEEGACSQQCSNNEGGYECFCKNGYELINKTCRAEGVDPLLIFTTLKEMRGMYVRKGNYFLIHSAINKASAVDVDPRMKEIYWIEISNQSSVYSSNITGGSIKTVLTHGLLVPEDIALDYVANNLYLTDSRLQQVMACKVDGTMCTVLHDTNVEKPRSIVLDPAERMMYWSDWGEEAHGIYRSGMEGSHRISLVSTGIGWPNGIAIDHSINRLYWADAKLSTIECITLDGNSRKVILSKPSFHPYSLAVFEDALYWTDWGTFSLESCDKFTGQEVTLLAREQNVHLMGVHVYHPVLMATVTNPCMNNECSHMCLMSPVSGFKCACPNGFYLEKDGKTCIRDENTESLFISEGNCVYHRQPKAVGSATITELCISQIGDISKVSYDSNMKYLFIADIKVPGIYAVNMSSLAVRTLVSNHIGYPKDLAFDWTSNNLYWIDSEKQIIEVLSIGSLNRTVLTEYLEKPLAFAISPVNGIMFIATVAEHSSIRKQDMDGNNEELIHSPKGLPVSLAIHPSESILYWADEKEGVISYLNYEKSSRSPRILVSDIPRVMSVAVNEEYVYWTCMQRELRFLKLNLKYVLQLPGQDNVRVHSARKVTYTSGTGTSGKSECLTNNGGCSYMCLTSPRGRTCICPSELILDYDNMTCVEKQCKEGDFKCLDGRCLSSNLRCNGNKDCNDGSDETDCGQTCLKEDFQCKNGKCILKTWQCDGRNDCGDNSDEENCSEITSCGNDLVRCPEGDCIALIWRCDGENDCPDGFDEDNCNNTVCKYSEFRCNYGQCVPVSWVCDGSSDCYDDSDEKNCSMCTSNEFRCKSDGRCVNQILKCDGRPDCSDESDEKNCPYSHHSCAKGMFQCRDGSCIYKYEICDSQNDCSDNEDEYNCTMVCTAPEEFRCSGSERCISRTLICDGDPDCPDESDENNCTESKDEQSTPSTEEQTASAFASNLSCYVCNSVNKGEEDCSTIAKDTTKFLQKCTAPFDKSCRIQEQWIYINVLRQTSKKRTIRQCASTPYDSEKQCYYGIGFGSKVKVCYCHEDGCNDSSRTASTALLNLILFSVLLIKYTVFSPQFV